MPILAVTSFRPRLFPPVFFNQFDKIPDLHPGFPCFPLFLLLITTLLIGYIIVNAALASV